MELPSPDIKSIDNALFIEHNVARIIGEQERYGVFFNSSKARRCIKVLERRQQRLYDLIRPSLSLEVVRPYAGPVNTPFKRDGDYTAVVYRWFDDSAAINQVGGPFSRVTFEEPDLGKRGRLQDQLLKPKITVDGEPCPSLQSIGSQLGKQLANWFTYRHRQSQIQGWLDRVRPDGRLPAGAITIGTPTYRMRHRVVVNVPKAAKHVLFGWQMRSLFTVPKGKRMVGFDASGLELRMMADVINDPTFTKEVTDGDPHSRNQRDAGLPTRDNAKTFIYAFIYGAGDAKIGSIIGGTRVQGSRIRRQFLAANPALETAINNTKRAAQRGYLVGCDGRRVHLRRDPETGRVQDHKAFNTRLQGGGARMMKYAMVSLDYWVKQIPNIDAHKVIDMHDEAQWECSPECADLVGHMGVEAIKQAGVMLGLRR